MRVLEMRQLHLLLGVPSDVLTYDEQSALHRLCPRKHVLGQDSEILTCSELKQSNT